MVSAYADGYENVGQRIAEQCRFRKQCQPPKGGEEGVKIDKGGEDKGEGKESAERKTVGKRRGGNVDFCSSFVLPPLLVPKVFLFAYFVRRG